MKVMDCLPLLSGWNAGSGSLYRQLATALSSAIAVGRLQAGARLPAERPLASALAVSRTTVVAAYDALREEGWIESRRGSGTRVRGRPPVPQAAAGHAVVGAPSPRAMPGASPEGGLASAAGWGARIAFFRGLVDASSSRIDFLGAHLPAAEPFVAEEWAAAAADLAAPLGPLAHHGYLGLGLPALREAIAAHLTVGGLPTTAEQVLVTSGAQQAIGVVAALYLRPGDAVALEDPTYPGALDAFGDARARLVAVPVVAEERGVDRLREAVAREAPRLIYLISSFHNPTGALMPEAHRRAVARLAADTGTPVLEDLTLADLDLGAPPPPPIAATLPGAPVLVVGSLSKLVWGGLRVGWVRAEAPVIARLARYKVLSDLGSSVPGQLLAARLLPHAAAIREARRRQVGERRQALETALAAALPDWSWRAPAGGLCLWVRLPRGNALDLARLALRHGVAIVPGPTFSPRDAWETYLRLPFVLAPEEAREGIARLARAWAAYAAAAPPRAAAGAHSPPPLEVLV
jgi:DNA-binding transcriptional MocR family regulator